MAEPIPLPEPLPIPPGQPVTVKALVITLWKLNGFIVSVGLCFAAEAVTRAFFGTVTGAIGWIPYLGSVAARPLHEIEHKITSFLGGLEAHIDPSVALYIQSLASVLGHLADGEIESSWAAWVLGKAIHGVRVTVHALPSLGKITHTTTTVVKQTKVIIKRVEHIGKIAAHAAPAAVARAVGVLEGEIEHVIEWDIPRLRARTKALEGEWGKALRWIRAHPLAIPEAAAAALVAAALARLGGSWIRCRNWNRIGKSVCRLPFSLIEGLLTDLIDVLLIADICQITRLMIGAAESRVVQDALGGIVTGMDELLLCQGVDRPPPLGGYWTDLPPAQAFSALPG